MFAIINISTGIAIIILAILIKIFNFSNLIAGYNTLPKNKKKDYDEKILIKYIFNTMLISAIILILGAVPSILKNISAEKYFTISWIAFTIFLISSIIYINISKKIKK